jgi:uncharacterized NAD-dependent epimerase/dehydratase family protein
MTLEKPYVLFLGAAHDALAAKTAFGIADWRPEWCVGQLRLEGCQVTTGLDDVTLEEAIAKGAKTLVIGVVNPGGFLAPEWLPVLKDALAGGLNLASGMHEKLGAHEDLRHLAEQTGRKLHDVRHSTVRLTTGIGKKRGGKRILTVGTDCSVGKKYTALALAKAMEEAGLKADFCATGQTGIFIADRGIAIDAVGADFIAGAAEWLSPHHEDPEHYDIIEGQGSLFHPSFAGVSLGLLHGSQPDYFIVCHEPTRITMRNVDHGLPSMSDVIKVTKSLGKLTNPNIACLGLAINTSALEKDEAQLMLQQLARDYHLPATDPIRFGVSCFLEALKNQ